MVKLTTNQALSSLLIDDVYLWKWLEAGLTKAYRRKMRSQLLKGLISIGQQQSLLLRCGYALASVESWFHPDYYPATRHKYLTDEAFAKLVGSPAVWLSTKQSYGLRRYYWHRLRSGMPIGLSTKVKLLISAGFLMQPPTWHYPAWPTKTRNRSFSTFHKRISIANQGTKV